MSYTVFVSHLILRIVRIFIFCHSHLADKSSRWEDPSGRVGVASGDSHHGNGSGPAIPSLLSMPTRSHMDITTPPLPQVSAEVLRVAEHRHRRGLMYPQIYHILTKVLQSHSMCLYHSNINLNMSNNCKNFRDCTCNL